MGRKPKKKKAGKQGRPTKYSKKHHLILAQALGELGLIDTQIAERMGVTEQTLNNWKKKHPDFKKALNNGKAVVDREVENSLLSLTRERETSETETIVKTNKQGQPIKGDTRIKRTIKKLIPSASACIFWLKNRRPDQWRDTQHINHGGDAIQKAGDQLAALFKKAK